MRENTKKILTWLYPMGVKKRSVRWSEIELLLSGLTEAGRKSCLYLLVKDSLVVTEVNDKETWLKLTNWGIAQIEDEMTILRRQAEVDEQYTFIILLESPKHDKEFKILRKRLQAYSLMLSRGVYVCPKASVSRLIGAEKKLFGKYLGSVLITAADDLMFGDWRELAIQKFEVKSLSKQYSGVSKQIEKLLIQVSLKKSAVKASKTEKMAIFDRLFYISQLDTGFMQLMTAFDVVDGEKKSGFSDLLRVLQNL